MKMYYNIANKSALHKMYFKVYLNFDQINADLMTISDLLQKYKILMYPNFLPIIILFFSTLPLFLHLSPCP